MSKIGKPIRSDRATAQKDILKYARVLVEVKVDQIFPEEISFENETGLTMSQKIHYECRPIFCGDCKGIGHTAEECRKKRFEVAAKKIKPQKTWVPKKIGVNEKAARVEVTAGEASGHNVLATMKEEGQAGEQEEECMAEVVKGPVTVKEGT